MSDFDRRQFLKGVLGKLALAAGTVVLASTSASSAGAPGSQPEGAETPPDDIQRRADELAASGNGAVGEAAAEANEFLNVGFRPGIGFRNGGWPNLGWRNGGWRNGGWPNLGWRNGLWHNGGWPNVGWRNWWG